MDIVTGTLLKSNVGGGGGRVSEAVGEPELFLIKGAIDGENMFRDAYMELEPCGQGCGVVPDPVEKFGVIPVAGGGQPNPVGVNGGSP